MADEHPRPPVAPHLSVSDGKAAVDFYKRAFGATEIMVMPAEDKKRIMHASLLINGGLVMLADEFPEYGGEGMKSPKSLGGSSITVHLEFKDVDAAYKRAVDAGAEATLPPQDMFWGDRYGQVKDPFGHFWSLASPVKK